MLAARLCEQMASDPPHAGARVRVDPMAERMLPSEEPTARVLRSASTSSGPPTAQHSVDEPSRRGQHLPAYARDGGRKNTKGGPPPRLLPAEYAARWERASTTQTVVLLLAHTGLARPGAWKQLLDDKRVALLIQCNQKLDAALRPYRYPKAAVTAWSDISLFKLLLDMLAMALTTYGDASSFWTCSGDGVPMVTAEALVDGGGESVLGIEARQVAPAMPQWEGLRARALEEANLPPMPWQCYGSQWIRLGREDAELLVRLGNQHYDALRSAFRATYAYASDGHDSNHSRMHPEEEFVPYLLHVIGRRPWPTAEGARKRVMLERTVAEVKCKACRYRAGHSALLTDQQERDMRGTAAGVGAAFMRKVCPRLP